MTTQQIADDQAMHTALTVLAGASIYGLLRISPRRCAIIQDNNFQLWSEDRVGFKLYKFVEGCESLSHADAITRLIELRKQEDGE